MEGLSSQTQITADFPLGWGTAWGFRKVIVQNAKKRIILVDRRVCDARVGWLMLLNPWSCV
jgi:hypothetical protein